MRKFTLFLSFVFAFLTASAQEVTVTSLDQLSNDKTYFIESARCFLMYNTTANADGISTSTAKKLGTSTVAKDWTDANQQFKIENIDGSYYLYSVGAAKYVTSNGGFSDTATDALGLTPSSDATYNWMLTIGGNGMNSQEPGQMDAGIVVNSWTTEDPGNRYKIIDAEASTVVVIDYPNELSEFDQNKCYTVTTTSRGGWAVANDAFCSTNDASLGTASNPADANQQFAVLSNDGENYYLYSVGAKKFVKSDKSLIAGRGEAIELADASSIGECRVRVNFKGYTDKYINLGGGKQMIIDNWSAIDAGNAVAFIEAGDFDPTEALAMLNNVATITYQFKYEGNVVATQEVVAVPGEAYPDYTLSAPYGVTGAAKPEGTVSGDETVTIELTITKALPFEAVAEGEPTKWYYAQIHGNFLSYMTNPGVGAEMPWKVNGELITAVDEANADNYTWGFVGNLWTGFKVVSKAGGAIKSTGSGNITIVENIEDATAFIAMAPITNDNAAAETGFCLLNAEADQYINAQNVGVNHWTANDAGSTIVVTEREITVEPEPEVTVEIDATKEYYLKSSWNYGMNSGYLALGNKSGANYGHAYMANDNSQAFKFTLVEDGANKYYTLSTEVTGTMSYTAYIDCSHASNVNSNAMGGSNLLLELENATSSKYVVKTANGYLKADMVSYGTDGSAYHVFSNGDRESALVFELVEKADAPEVAAPVITEIIPANGAEVTSLSEIVITFDKAIKAVDTMNGIIKVKTTGSTSRAYGYDATISDDGLTVTFPIGDDMNGFKTIDAEGEYTIEIPAGVVTSTDGAKNEAATYTFTIAGTVEPETPATLNETVVFDFTNGAWSIPTMEQNNYSNIKTAGEYTDGAKTINIDPTANGGSYIYDNKGFLNISKPGTKIILPAFGFAVEKIEVVGHSSATSYPNVDMNVFVGGNAVSTACIGSTETYTYEIAADNQAAGNVYELVIGSNGGNYSSVMYITYIKVYPAENKLEAPVIDLASGVYVGAQTVNVHSATADIEGVTNVTYYYTTNGNEPTVEDEETDGEITIENSCTLKVIVELTYGDKTYVSASTSAEYIISEAVTYHRATSVESGSYFIVADGNMAAPIEGTSLPTVEVAVEGNDVTAPAYYAVTLEETAGGYYIKDVNGNYIYNTMMTPHKLSFGTSAPMDAWTITIADDENSTATIMCNGYALALNKGVFCTVSLGGTDIPVMPTLYGTHATGINEAVVNGEAIESIYDLQGRKLEKVTEGGIYIVNGKKILVK